MNTEFINSVNNIQLLYTTFASLTERAESDLVTVYFDHLFTNTVSRK